VRRTTSIAASLLLSASVAAAEVRVSAALEPRGRVAEDQAVRLIVRVEGTFGDAIEAPKLPALRNLRVLSGPSTSRSSRFEFINGRATTSTEAAYVYTLLPERPGPAEVPPVEVRVDGEVYRTAALSLEVSGATGPGGAPTPGGPERPPAAEEQEVFLRAETSAREVFVGEPLTLEVRLYSARQVAAFDWSETPDLGGFWTEDLGADPRAEAFRSSIGGREHAVYPLVRRVLVPTTAGEIEIGPYVAEVQVPRRARDLFSEFLGRGAVESMVRKSPAVKVVAKPLPDEGKPSDFGGDVGSFRLEAAVDRKEASVNDAVALSVTVRGEGWLAGGRAPALAVGDRFKVFDATSRGSSNVQGDSLRSERTWEWVLVPLVPGDAVLPTVRFSYFDPKSGRYRTESVEPGTLTVRRGEAAPEGTTARSILVPERRELRFLKSREGELERGDARWHRSGWFRLLAFLPWIAGPLFVVLARRRARLLGDRGRLRASRALKRARRTLRAAEKGAGGFHETVARALVEYVADRHDRSAAGLTHDLADQLLAGDGVDPDLRGRFRSCLERCDFARYVPGSGEGAGREGIVREAGEILEALERRR
jgi:hypothetical protein